MDHDGGTVRCSDWMDCVVSRSKSLLAMAEGHRAGFKRACGTLPMAYHFRLRQGADSRCLRAQYCRGNSWEPPKQAPSTLPTCWGRCSRRWRRLSIPSRIWRQHSCHSPHSSRRAHSMLRSSQLSTTCNSGGWAGRHPRQGGFRSVDRVGCVLWNHSPTRQSGQEEEANRRAWQAANYPRRFGSFQDARAWADRFFQ